MADFPLSSPNNGAPNGGTTLRQDDHQLLDQLEKLWWPNRMDGLNVRWKMGSLLNEHLGPPTVRQAHGKRILKHAAERLQIAESDLSRMRWFAVLFPSVEDWQAKYPEARSWTKVKKLLPKVNAAAHGKEVKSSPVDGSGEQSPGNQQESGPVGALLRHLNTATKRLRQGKLHLDSAAQERVCEAIQQFSEVASAYLGIRVTVEKV
jgi:hypothetical protein